MQRPPIFLLYNQQLKSLGAILQALVSGTGVSGIAVCLLRVATKATLPDTPKGLRASANAYFTLAALVCASCVVLYAMVLPRLPVIQYYRQVINQSISQSRKLSDAGPGGGAVVVEGIEGAAMDR